MTKEKGLINDILVAASRLGRRLFRVNTGLGWIGRAERFSKQTFVKVMAGDVVIRAARPLHAGLCEGGSDIIGWTPIEITPEMIGRKVAVFTAIEVKTENVRTTKEQANFIDAVKKDGGFARVARSVEEGVTLET